MRVLEELEKDIAEKIMLVALEEAKKFNALSMAHDKRMRS